MTIARLCLIPQAAVKAGSGSFSSERVKHANLVLPKSSHDQRVEIITRINRQHRNKNDSVSAQPPRDS